MIRHKLKTRKRYKGGKIVKNLKYMYATTRIRELAIARNQSTKRINSIKKSIRITNI